MAGRTDGQRRPRAEDGLNRLITAEEFAKAAIEAMHAAEDKAGVPRGSIAVAFVEEFNRRIEAPPAGEAGSIG